MSPEDPLRSLLNSAVTAAEHTVLYERWVQFRFRRELDALEHSARSTPRSRRTANPLLDDMAALSAIDSFTHPDLLSY